MKNLSGFIRTRLQPCCKPYKILAEGTFSLPFRSFVTIFVTLLTASVLLAQATGSYSITGTVINGVTGSPLPHSSVSLLLSKDRTQAASVIADDHGAFRFLHLPAGRYILSASHRGYLTANYDGHDGFTTALVTGEGLDCCSNLQMRLIPGGVISGVVSEDSGDVVSQGRVTLYRESNQDGSERVRRVRTESLDETGAYEISGLQPGNYFLAVTAQPWYATQVRGMQLRTRRNANGSEDTSNETHSPLDLVYATTFYPDTTDETAATPIPIKGGDHLQINFSLHPVPAVHVKVQLPARTGERNSPFSPPQIQQTIFGSTEYISSPTFIHGDSEGHFEAELSAPPGQYVVRTSDNAGVPGRQMAVDITTDQTLNIATGAPLADVTGKFALASGEAIPENLFVSLQQVSNGQGAGGDRVEKDGTFTIHNVAPGTYHINFFANGKRLHVTRMVANGAKIAHRQITIGSGPVTLAGLLYPDLGLSVSGFVKKDGKPVPGAMVVLVPSDPADYRDYFRRDQSNSDGSFEFQNVEPGKYTIIAIQDGWTLDWAEPDVIRRYLPQGQPVNITGHSPQKTELPQPVEVQAR
jgi:hypothetical protein